MESIISTFHIDWKIIIAQALNFGVVFVVLYIFALKPLSKLMAERSEKIAKGLGDANENAAILEKSKQERESILKEARIEAQKIFEQGKKDGVAEHTNMVENGKQEVARMVEASKKTLETEKVKMVNEAKEEVVSLAILAAKKIMEDKNQKN